MNEESEEIPEEILLRAKKAIEIVVPQKSKKIYEKELSRFEEWMTEHLVNVINETVMMAYFQKLSETFSPNSLWTKFSMLRKELMVKKKIRSTEKFLHLQEFLKQICRGYRPKKSKVLTRDQVLEFLKEAPTEIYLMFKVALVIGIFGACRKYEFAKMKFTDVQDKGAFISIYIPNSKNGQARSFIIIEESEMNALNLIRQYILLRPKNASNNRFFLSYRDKRCTVQPVGKNTFGNIPCRVATYLGLKDAKEYTGHCLRRTSATLLSDAGGTTENLMRLGGWKSSSVARGYVDNSECSQGVNSCLVAGIKSNTSISTAVNSSTIQIMTSVDSRSTSNTKQHENIEFSG